ncbi:hypothetical protein EXU85_20445 [Spirosoma sp. KCTC 42546]|uniref:hypothetical protein n=1 Tax=Spirosoma sp. KCTC 42546 TaxID=2520506 RepID=UPI00115BBEFC|nr:hypothetical protein [Spirosoma sp. KCTC 42546]QDK80850.1 hypothetical protein EXU85_20445 [Spirosoma sp. KCTC 42546]
METVFDLLASPITQLRPHVKLVELDDLGPVTRCIMQVGKYRLKRLQSKQLRQLDDNGQNRDVSNVIWENPQGGYFDEREVVILEAIFQECCVTGIVELEEDSRRFRRNKSLSEYGNRI